MTHLPLSNPITPEQAMIVADLKKQYDNLRRANHPDVLLVDLNTNDIVKFYYPTYDKDLTFPVPMEEFNEHWVTYQFGHIGCFCKLLNGRSVRPRIFRCTRPDSEWVNWWIIGCGAYQQDANPGCGLWFPLGTASVGIWSRDFFVRPGSEPPLHYYPPIGSPPNPYPREVFTLAEFDGITLDTPALPPPPPPTRPAQRTCPTPRRRRVQAEASNSSLSGKCYAITI